MYKEKRFQHFRSHAQRQNGNGMVETKHECITHNVNRRTCTWLASTTCWKATGWSLLAFASADCGRPSRSFRCLDAASWRQSAPLSARYNRPVCRRPALSGLGFGPSGTQTENIDWLIVSLPFIFYFVWFVFLVCFYYVYLYMGQVPELKLMMMMIDWLIDWLID